MAPFVYYVERSSDLLMLRQTRLRDQRQTHGGEGHPHDVCAVARDRKTLEQMAAMIGGNVDWSALDNEGNS